MKNLVIILISIISLSSCKAQDNNTIMQLDIENFKKGYSYTEDSARIQRFTAGSDFIILEAKKDSLHTNRYEYNKKGSLILKGKDIQNGSGQLGKWYEYDEKGNITKVTNYDLPFTFTLDSLQAYAKRNEIDLLKTRIMRSEYYGWELSYTGKYRGKYGSFYIVLDKQTGEELLVKKRVNRLDRKPIDGGDSYIEVPGSDTIYYKGQPYKQK